MRVLHLINAFNRGGVEKWLLNMLAQIPRDSCAIDVCCKGADIGPWAPLARDAGARIYHCPLRPSQVGFILGLRRILRENRYDLVHNHLGAYAGLAVWVARSVGTPIMTTFHTARLAPALPIFKLPILFQLRRLYGTVSIRYAKRNSDAITAVSGGVLDHMVPPNSPMRHKCAILYLGVDITARASSEDKTAFRESMGWTADTPVVMHVGRFYEQKNHFGLLAVFERVLREVPEAKLVLVGEGPLEERVKAYVATNGLNQAVRMLGARNNAASLIACSDVLLFPSLFEGFGIVALEANAAGVPVVGSDVLGLNEAVENGSTAVLWEVDDVTSMAGSVVRILKDREYASSLGEAGRIRAERLFSVKASAEKLVRLYRDVLARHQHNGANKPSITGSHG